MIEDVTGTRAVIAALLILGLAGCTSDDPKPKVAPSSPTAPTSPSTTEAAEPTPPEMPEAAKGTDAKAAEVFAEFFFEMVNYAQSTGDVAGLEALARKCAGCEGGSSMIADAYRRGGEIRGGTGSVRELEIGFLNRDPKPWASVECTIVTDKQTVDLPGHEDDESFPAGSTDVRLLLEPTSTGWVVRSLVTR